MPPAQDDQPTPEQLDEQAAAAEAGQTDAATELDRRLEEIAELEAERADLLSKQLDATAADTPLGELTASGAVDPDGFDVDTDPDTDAAIAADEQADESRPFELSTLEQIGLMQARGAVMGVAQQAQSLNQVVIDEVRETLAAERRRQTITGGSEEDLDALYTELKIIGAVEKFRQVLTDIQEKAAARAAIRTPAGPTPEQLAAAAVAQPNGGGPQG